MDINIVTRFNQDVDNFVTKFSEINAAIEEMRKIRRAYNNRRDTDSKEVEYQRKNLALIMGSDDFSATERAEAKQKLAQLEFHTFIPTQNEQEAYRAARKRAELCASELSDCRHALEASRKALKDAFVADDIRTLKNDMSTYVFVKNKIDGLPYNL